MGALRGESRGRAPSHETKVTLTHVKALEMEYLSPYRGFVRGICREGFCSEDSDRRVTEGSENGAFL